MYIKRYPLSDSSKIQKTDDCDLKNELKNDEVDLDITLDKTGQRESRVVIGFNLDDYKSLHNRFIEKLEERHLAHLEKSSMEIDNLKHTVALLIRILHSDLKNDEETIEAIDQLIEFNFLEALGKIENFNKISIDELKEAIISKSCNPV